MATLSQTAFGFYTEGTEAGSALVGSANRNLYIQLTDTRIYFIRIRIQETGGTGTTGVTNIYYSKNGDTWTKVNNLVSATNMYLVDSSFVTTSISSTTNRLGSGTGSFVAGAILEVNNVSGNAPTASNYTEYLFPFSILPANLAEGDRLEIKFYNANVAIASYTAIPTINIIDPYSNLRGISSFAKVSSIKL